MITPVPRFLYPLLWFLLMISLSLLWSSPFLTAVFTLLWAMTVDLQQAETQQAFYRQCIVSCVWGSRCGSSGPVFACFCLSWQSLWTAGPSHEQDGTVGDGALLARLGGFNQPNRCGKSWPVFYWDLWWERCLWVKDLLQWDGPVRLSGQSEVDGERLSTPTVPSTGPDMLRAVLFSSLEPTGEIKGIYPANKQIFIEYLLCARHHYRAVCSIANKTDKISAFMKLAF